MISGLFAVSSLLQYFSGISLFLVSLFLILLVLVQRGRGGGLSGAFGGMGGQSAFGSKAGDVFTRITVGTAAVWILLCVLLIFMLNRDSGTPFGRGSGDNAGQLGPIDPSEDDSNEESNTSNSSQSSDSSPQEEASNSN